MKKFTVLVDDAYAERFIFVIDNFRILNKKSAAIVRVEDVAAITKGGAGDGHGGVGD